MREGPCRSTTSRRNGWTVTSSPGRRRQLVWERRRHGTALRLDYDLANGSGFVIVRKALRLPLPENFAFTFRLRGEAAARTLEFKLVDAGGNVWWRRWRDFAFPRTGSADVRRSRLTYAWGPAATSGRAKRSRIEIAISGGEAGPGTVWIDDLVLEAREPVERRTASPAGHRVELAARARARARRRRRRRRAGGASGARPAVADLDFGRNREYGGLVIDWDPDDYAIAYGVEVSTDGAAWQRRSTPTGNGGRDYVYMPDAESRYVRLDLERSSRGAATASPTSP